MKTSRARTARLIIVCGLPGSGKTTLARRLAEERGAIRFCPDEWMQAMRVNLWDEALRARIEGLQWEVGQQLLQQDRTVIIEWGTWAREERDALRVRARSLGAAVEMHYLAAPAEVLFERVRARGREEPPITWDNVLQWFETFQAPTTAEFALFDPPVEPARAACVAPRLRR